MITRRSFLASSAALTLSRALSPSIARSLAPAATHQPLTNGWEYLQDSLAGPWEAWLTDESNTWTPVTLPHCFNSYDACDPDRPYYQGRGWYRTHLPFPADLDAGRLLLHFAGAGQETTIYIGTKQLHNHIGGYDEFVVDITDAALAHRADKPGIPVAIQCTNAHNLDRIPSQMSDFTLYGGIYRPLTLVSVPALSIEALHITPRLAPAGPGSADISLRLYNPARIAGAATITLRITDPAGKQIHTSSSPAPNPASSTDTNLYLATVAIPSPQLWSPSTPHLYTCAATLHSPAGDHTVSERFGLRSYEFLEHGPFHLNGERLLLRGTHRHEDHAGFAAAMPADLIRQELTLMKQMGANFLRLAHYQQNRQVLELCDELGICVWEELPWCRGGIGNEAFKTMAREKLGNMLDQHRNHPSVILWGLGNEDDWPGEYPSIDKDAIRSFMTELRDLAHSLDPTRLTSFRRCDFARDIPDVYSPSIWAGWYSGTYPEYEASLTRERERVKRLIHIEWGADSHAGRHAEDPNADLHIATGHGTDERGFAFRNTGGAPRVSRDGDWSETYACDLFDWHLGVQESLPWLTGSAQWIFKDFTTPLRPENPIPRINQKGLVERDLTRKEAYFVFQSFWSPELMAHIYGHSWPVRWGAPGQQRLIRVYSNATEVELFVNGKSAGSKKRTPGDFPCSGLRWQLAFQPGENHLRVLAHRAGRTVSDELRFTYQTEPWGKPSQLRLSPGPTRDNATVLEATLHDEHGTLCLDARNVVHFSVAGSGRLRDNLGTASGSRTVQLTNGRARITVERQPGLACTAGVASPGLPTATASLT